MTQAPTDALRLVPVEPTEAMQNAGVDAATNLFEGWVDEGQVSTLYRAMLAAAPDMMCCDNCGTIRGKADECDCSLHDGTPPVWVSAAPASPLPGSGEPTAEMIRVGAWRAKLHREANPGDTWEETAREVFTVMMAAAPTGDA